MPDDLHPMPNGAYPEVPAAKDLRSSLPRAIRPRTSWHDWRREALACLALSWPLILTNAIEMAMNATNVAMIGRLGPEPLAAASLGTGLFSVFLLFGIGVIAALSPLLVRERGQGTAAAPVVRRILQQGFWGAALITGPIWLVLWQGEPIFIALGQEPGLAREAGAYLHHLQWALLPALLYLVLRSFLAAFERPRWAAATGAAAVLLNAGLNWLFINGYAGLPALGISGSGLATLTSNIFMFAALALVVITDRHFRTIGVFSGAWRPDWRGFTAFWRLGLPIGVTLVLEVGLFSAATALAGLVSTSALAAHAIALQVASFSFMVPLGISQAATVRVGRAVGSRDWAGAVRSGRTALAFVLAAMVLSGAIMVTIPDAIIALFLDLGDARNLEAARLASTLLGIAAAFQIADGSQVVEAGMLRGLHDTRVPMVVAGVGYWVVGLPLSAVLAFRLHLGAPGIWIGLSAGLFTVAILLLVRWGQHERRLRALP